MNPDLGRGSRATYMSINVRRTGTEVRIGLAMGLWSSLLPAPIVHAQAVEPSTLNNKILAGYQGWFNAPGDGTIMGWSHWSRSFSDIGPGLYHIDLWPDISEFDPDELF